MNLTLQRVEVSNNGKATIGHLLVNDVFECFTLEDVTRKVKIAHETAIPAGFYDVTIDYSPKFGRPMPHVLNVPGFDGIRIHTGNTDVDTWGCLLLGRTHIKGQDFIGESTLAFQAFVPKLQAAIDGGESCRIAIYDVPAPPTGVEGVDN